MFAEYEYTIYQRADTRIAGQMQLRAEHIVHQCVHYGITNRINIVKIKSY